MRACVTGKKNSNVVLTKTGPHRVSDTSWSFRSRRTAIAEETGVRTNTACTENEYQPRIMSHSETLTRTLSRTLPGEEWDVSPCVPALAG